MNVTPLQIMVGPVQSPKQPVARATHHWIVISSVSLRCAEIKTAKQEKNDSRNSRHLWAVMMGPACCPAEPHKGLLMVNLQHRFRLLSPVRRFTDKFQVCAENIAITTSDYFKNSTPTTPINMALTIRREYNIFPLWKEGLLGLYSVDHIIRVSTI